jgi:hypothetical protein
MAVLYTWTREKGEVWRENNACIWSISVMIVQCQPTYSEINLPQCHIGHKCGENCLGPPNYQSYGIAHVQFRESARLLLLN